MLKNKTRKTENFTAEQAAQLARQYQDSYRPIEMIQVQNKVNKILDRLLHKIKKRSLTGEFNLSYTVVPFHYRWFHDFEMYQKLRGFFWDEVTYYLKISLEKLGYSIHEQSFQFHITW